MFVGAKVAGLDEEGKELLPHLVLNVAWVMWFLSLWNLFLQPDSHLFRGGK